MKIATFLLPLVLLAGCSSPDSTSPTTATTPTPAAQAPAATGPAGEATAVSTASASGVVESVDAAAKTVTIALAAVESLEWPPMTMTFKAADVDLSVIKQGDQVSLQFTSVGMDGTITSITRQ